jgi:nicotinamide riboside kinase
MRVYFIGAHSTGKTTLARYVSGKYNIPMITEVARMILSERELHLDSLRTNLDIVDQYQSDIFFRQIDEESKQLSFVSDRSFDCLAYAAQHSRVLPKLLHCQELHTYLEILRSPESFIFFVRPSKATMKEDGIRESLTWDGVIAIDSMIKFMLEMWGLRYFQLPIDNMQERTKVIDSILSLYKE